MNNNYTNNTATTIFGFMINIDYKFSSIEIDRKKS